MPSRREVGAALYGAWRLMRFDAGGLASFDFSISGFWRSFFAAALLAPAFVVLVWLELAARTEPVNVGWAMVVSGAGYVAGWVAFPLAAILITRLLDLGGRYLPLIVAYNWVSVPQVAVYLPTVLIATAAPAIGAVFQMAAVAYILVFEWFVIRTVLDTTPFTAVAIVIVEVVLGEFVHQAANSLI